ncbi:hypothetical protein BC833DRAFT_624517 [Globomyces pollinis-pini]|nr:hypothetical protein BC833DRAFT_624517 [Globomyces pollinis-pini]
MTHSPPRKFLNMVNPIVCNGTVIATCKKGVMEESSKYCGTCRTNIRRLKTTICKYWNNRTLDPTALEQYREELMQRDEKNLVNIVNHCRMDPKEAIERITKWKMKEEGMKVLWYNPVPAEIINWEHSARSKDDAPKKTGQESPKMIKEVLDCAKGW